ncbi:MAG: HEPN domain-containing protein [Actinomycetia bacterium]|nr:HEPN domain-containing protein [Actinomycetes bacterium]
MAFRYSNCIEKGLLRKLPPSPQKADMSLVKAEKWSDEAEKSLNGNALDASVIASYLVMFHSARAILYYDGYREKSHACVARYLEEKYMKPGRLDKKWIELLDHNREMRHNNQYDLSFCSTEEEAVKALETANKFLGIMKELLSSLKANL